MKLQFGLIILLIIFIILSYCYGSTPPLVGFCFFVVSFVTYFVYAKDKNAARNKTGRISEDTLHFMSLICGWPGAIIAQQKLRHKTIKKEFRVVFWITVVINVLGLAWLHTESGDHFLRTTTARANEWVVDEVDSPIIEGMVKSLLGYKSRMKIKYIK